MSSEDFKICPGKSFPSLSYGAIVEEGGVMFRLFSRHAQRLFLMLFDSPDDTQPSREIEFSPDKYRSGDIWHMFVQGLKPGQLYLFRMDGPWEPHNGHLYQSDQWLIDPYAKAVTGTNGWGEFSSGLHVIDNNNRHSDFYKKLQFAGSPKCVVVDDRFDWGDDKRPDYQPNESVIYEAHVRGLSVHPSSGVRYPGTFRGLIDIIPHLRELGITTLELLPVQEFNELELNRINKLTGEKLLNYWGYSTVSFFAPNRQYASGKPGEASPVTEFKQMVKSMHAAGIEVILDIVFNHTAEGNYNGPVYNFKGIDNSIYYMLDENDRTEYKNYSGCGNTFNCNHPVVRQYIIDCLRYWVLEMHIDGFRFDLASILGRDQRGNLMENPPLIEGIAEDPVLRNTRLIAEAWDAGGAYQVGSFPGERWAEWNGKFRDDVRGFLRGDTHKRADFAYRLTGSSDLYRTNGRKPVNSINFITSHDGFTLHDLTTYNEKHNEANGEDNRDGDNHNLSCNFGVEGETDDDSINVFRTRQIKNYLTVLLLSQGVPMLNAGDEFRRTQRGNNNPYCQDNEISWMNWNFKAENFEIYRFTRLLIKMRKNHPVFRRTGFFTGKAVDLNKIADITWYDFNGRQPDWNIPSGSLACMIHGRSSYPHSYTLDDDFFIMVNTGDEAVKFRLPPPPSKSQWYVAVNTARTGPHDIFEVGKEEPSIWNDKTFWTVSKSIVVLKSKNV